MHLEDPKCMNVRYLEAPMLEEMIANRFSLRVFYSVETKLSLSEGRLSLLSGGGI